MICNTVYLTNSAYKRWHFLDDLVRRMRSNGWNEGEIEDSVAYLFFAWTREVGVVPELDVPVQSGDYEKGIAAEGFSCGTCLACM